MKQAQHFVHLVGDHTPGAWMRHDEYDDHFHRESGEAVYDDHFHRESGEAVYRAQRAPHVHPVGHSDARHHDGYDEHRHDKQGTAHYLIVAAGSADAQDELNREALANREVLAAAAKHPMPRTMEEYRIEAAARGYDEQGVKDDADKVPFDLVPWDVVEGAARVFGFGRTKYGAYNWYGLSKSRLFGSALRHLVAWWLGEDLDPETKMPHLHHAASCVLMLASRHGRDDRREGGSS